MTRETTDGDSESGAGRCAPGGIRSQRVSSCVGLVEERLVWSSARNLEGAQGSGSADEGVDPLGDRGSSGIWVSPHLPGVVRTSGGAGEPQTGASCPAVLRVGSSSAPACIDAFPRAAGDCRSREFRRPDEGSSFRSHGSVLHRLHGVGVCRRRAEGMVHGVGGHRQSPPGAIERLRWTRWGIYDEAWETAISRWRAW